MPFSGSNESNSYKSAQRNVLIAVHGRSFVACAIGAQRWRPLLVIDDEYRTAIFRDIIVAFEEVARSLTSTCMTDNQRRES